MQIMRKSPDELPERFNFFYGVLIPVAVFNRRHKPFVKFEAVAPGHRIGYGGDFAVSQQRCRNGHCRKLNVFFLCVRAGCQPHQQEQSERNTHPL